MSPEEIALLGKLNASFAALVQEVHDHMKADQQHRLLLSGELIVLSQFREEHLIKHSYDSGRGQLKMAVLTALIGSPITAALAAVLVRLLERLF